MSQTISNNLSVANSLTSNNITSSNANIQNISVDNLSITSSLNTNNINLNCNNITSSGSISTTSLSVPNLNLTSLNLNGVDLNTRITAIENKDISQDTNINNLNTNVSNNTTSINTLNTNVSNNSSSINTINTSLNNKPNLNSGNVFTGTTNSFKNIKCDRVDALGTEVYSESQFTFNTDNFRLKNQSAGGYYNVGTQLVNYDNSINTLTTNTTGLTYSNSLQTSVLNRLQITNTLTQSSIIEATQTLDSQFGTTYGVSFPIYRNYIIVGSQSITIRFPLAPSFAIGQIITIKRINYNGLRDNIGISGAQFGTNINIDSSLQNVFTLSNSSVSATSSLISNVDCYNYEISVLIVSETIYRLLVNGIFNFPNALTFNRYINITTSPYDITTSNLSSLYIIKTNASTQIFLTPLTQLYDGITITIRNAMNSTAYTITPANGATVRSITNSNGGFSEANKNCSVFTYSFGDNTWYELIRS